MHISYMYYRTIYVYNDILIYIPISDPRFHIKYGNRLIAASLESKNVETRASPAAAECS